MRGRSLRPARSRPTGSVARSASHLEFEDPVAHVRAFGRKIPDAYPSLVLDLRAGRRTEISFINGAIPRVGHEVGLQAPVNATVTGLVEALESRRADG